LEKTAPAPKQYFGVSLAVVVGNGFPIDCTEQLGLSGIDVSRPVNWPLNIPNQPDISIREALPHFFKAYDELQLTRPEASQFELLREIMEIQTTRGSYQEVEARHFLAFAYRFFHSVLAMGPLERWRWLQWFHAYAHLLLMTVSLNYDLLLERVLYLVGRQTNRIQGKVDLGILRMFKPHGSADFDLINFICHRGLLRYPIQMYGHMNDFSLRIVPASEWSHPPFEPVIVLPYEKNPYWNYQWVKPGYSIYEQLAQHFTHCVFLGLSYHQADRQEIDHFLYSTRRDCRIIVANPTPPQEFLAAIKASGRSLHVWLDGPESLPIS
jgi:hypothetical protein